MDSRPAGPAGPTSPRLRLARVHSAAPFTFHFLSSSAAAQLALALLPLSQQTPHTDPRPAGPAPTPSPCSLACACLKSLGFCGSGGAGAPMVDAWADVQVWGNRDVGGCTPPPPISTQRRHHRLRTAAHNETRVPKRSRVHARCCRDRTRTRNAATTMGAPPPPFPFPSCPYPPVHVNANVNTGSPCPRLHWMPTSPSSPSLRVHRCGGIDAVGECATIRVASALADTAPTPAPPALPLYL
ncbi:hypothetical protein B0H10DRAFT_2441104 [Mycena sp. CBHHK59/15]|nr:hypothetical protein B0H10DRAFT_2441104 [Mycena sp. CBHHK59/15]